MAAAAPAWVAAVLSDDDDDDADGVPGAALAEAEFYVAEDDDVQVLNVLNHEKQHHGAEAVGHDMSVWESNLPRTGKRYKSGGEVFQFAAAKTPVDSHQHSEISPKKRRKKTRQRKRMRAANFEMQSPTGVDGGLCDTVTGSQLRALANLGGCHAPHLQEQGILAGGWPLSELRNQVFLESGLTSAHVGPGKMLMEQAHIYGTSVVQEQYSNVTGPQQPREHGILGGGPPSQLRGRGILQFKEQGLPDSAPIGSQRFLSAEVHNNGRFVDPGQNYSLGAPQLRGQPYGLLGRAPVATPRRMMTGKTMGECWSSLQPTVGMDLSPLHWDILNFCKAHELTPQQMQDRREALECVEHAVHELWPSAEVHLFGSTATGLALPWSDIDVAVMSLDQHGNVQKSVTISCLSALCTYLKKQGHCKSLKQIPHAKVPLLKIVFKSGLACDISFDAHNGPRGVPVINRFMQLHGALRPLCLVLKCFLGQHDLNELYTGGLGSFCLINMVVSHLQKLELKGAGHDLGALLLSFFTRYSTMHNYRTDVVSTRAGFCASKQVKGWVNYRDPELLAVEDPLDPTSDLSKGSYRMQDVRTKFRKAERLLLTHWHQENILAQLVDVTGNSNQRRKRQAQTFEVANQPKLKKRKKHKHKVGVEQEDAQPGSVQRKQKLHPTQQGGYVVGKEKDEVGVEEVDALQVSAPRMLKVLPVQKSNYVFERNRFQNKRKKMKRKRNRARAKEDRAEEAQVWYDFSGPPSSPTLKSRKGHRKGQGRNRKQGSLV